MEDTSSGPDRILFRAPNWLGDAVMAAAAVESVRSLLPRAHIGLAIKENIAGLGGLLPAVNQVHPLPPPGPGLNLALAHISAQKYEKLILFPNSFRSAWELWRSGIRLRAGYSGIIRSLLLTHTVPRPAKHSMNQRDYFMALAGSVFPGLTAEAPRLVIPQEAMAKSYSLLPDDGRPLAGIGFGATYGAAKMWPAQRFAQLIDGLAPNARVVLLGAPSDGPVETRVMELSASRLLSLVGRTDIPTLAAILKRLAVYITNDTGPMHLASALGAPVVAIFGPTDPAETAPAGPMVQIIRRKADCAPCWKRQCPIDHRCMTAISVDEVGEAAMNFINRQRA